MLTPREIASHAPDLSGENLLINGDMRVWQRGTSFALASGYTADHFWSSNVDVTKVEASGYDYLRAVVQSVSQTIYWRQPIELGCNKLYGKKVTVSFRAAVSEETIVSVRLREHGQSVDIETKNVTLTLGGFQDYQVTLDVGTSFVSINSALDVEMSKSAPTLSSVVSTYNIKVEEGSVATPFVPRPVEEELALCQRYFNSGRMLWQGSNTSNHYCATHQQYPVPMRAVPTITMTHAGSQHFNGTPELVEVKADAIGLRELASSTGNGYWLIDWTADAEI